MHGALPASVLFCIATFALSSFRASLNPENLFDLLDPKRILLVAAGAAVFWLAIRQTDRLLPDMRGFGRIALVSVPGLIALFVLAAGWDVLVERRLDNVAARNLRWILLWSGYFGTGIAAWLVIQYRAALTHAQISGAPEGAPSHEGDAGTPASGFWVTTGRQTIHIARDAVEWIGAEGNYARVHSRDGAQGLVRMTLAGIEAELDPADFIRTHRSALCRRSAICGYRRKRSGAMLVLLASGAEVPLGRSYAKILVEQTRNMTENDTAAANDTVSRGEREVQPG